MTHNNRQAPPRFTPCGQSRREFIWQAGGGFVGTALTYLLAGDGFFAGRAAAAPAPNPLAPKQPHFPAKARACICLFMYGGPSQVDLFDPKPELTKRSGQPMPSEAPPAPLKESGNAVMPPARTQMIENEIAKFWNSPMRRDSSCEYPME